MSPPAPRLLLAAAFLLFATWSLVVPIYETPDEPAHWQYARYLRDHWTLPLYTPELRARPTRRRSRTRCSRRSRSSDGLAGRPAQPARRTATLVSLAEPRRFLNTGEAYRQFWPQRLARLAGGRDLGRHRLLRRGGPALAAGGPAIGLAGGADRGAAADVHLPRRRHQQRRGGRLLLRGGDVGLGPPAARAVRVAGRLVDVGRGRPRLPVEDQRDRARAAVRAGAPRRRASRRRGERPGLAPRRRWPWPARSSRRGRSATSCSTGIRSPARRCGTRSPTSSPTARCSRRTSSATFPRMLGKSFIGVFGWANVTMPPLAYRPYVLLFALGLGGATVAAAGGDASTGGWSRCSRSPAWRRSPSWSASTCSSRSRRAATSALPAGLRRS